MTKRVLVAALLFATPLAALGDLMYSWTESQALSRAAPTLATEGISLADIRGYRVVASAGAAATITGGSLLCYYYSPNTARWARCSAALDLTLATGARDSVSADFRVAAGAGRLLYAASSVTLSSGSAVVVTVEALGAP
jgi:hypothetical protein